jgi:hypothetical protein
MKEIGMRSEEADSSCMPRLGKARADSVQIRNQGQIRFPLSGYNDDEVTLPDVVVLLRKYIIPTMSDMIQ